MVWSGERADVDGATVTGFFLDLQARHGLRPVGPPSVAQGPGGVTGAQMLERGQATVRQTGQKVRVTVDVDGSVDVARLKALVEGAFSLRNWTLIEDEVDL